MNAELAYCLERFIDDQIQMIDDNLETVKQNETVECQRIEQMKIASAKKRKPPINKGNHDEDERMVGKFVTGLIDLADGEKTPVAIAMKKYREMLHNEFSAKIDDCEHHLTRLRKLASPIGRSRDFVILCDETIAFIRQRRKAPDNFAELDQILSKSDSETIAHDIQQWWNRTYASDVRKMIRLNQRFNPHVGNADITTISLWSQPIDCARKFVHVRKGKVVADAQIKYELISEFVRQIQSIDEENRRDIDQNELINQLNNMDIDSAKKYAETWLDKRDQLRNEKEEDDPYDIQMQEVKVQFERQRIAQESKKLALATLLRRLAIGSDNVEKFDEKLKDTIQKQKKKSGVPVVTGDMGDPNTEKLSISIRMTGIDVKQWSNNSDQIQEKFGAALCEAFLIPLGNIRITGIDSRDGNIQAYVVPPYGKNVIDSLNGTATDSPARIKSVRECCLAFKGKIESIGLGEMGLSIDDKLMDPLWNRKYLWAKSDTEEGEFWEKSIDRGGKPYFCPSGWFRFGIKVAENQKEFDKLWGNWYLAYHGTQSKYAVDILTTGLRMSTTGCYFNKGIPRVYVSPSIEYCAHKRYAKPWSKIEKDDKKRWFQVVLQCRVNPAAVRLDKPETLLKLDSKTTVTIDPNFTNEELEWIIPGQEGTYYMNRDIICYGLMMRISDVDPETLPVSAWWKYVYDEIAAMKYT